MEEIGKVGGVGFDKAENDKNLKEFVSIIIYLIVTINLCCSQSTSSKAGNLTWASEDLC
jgi:hypothetical protein